MTECYATLVVCYGCNSNELIDSRLWPRARQLALLKLRHPESYDLAAFNHLVNPRAPFRITGEEVGFYYTELLQLEQQKEGPSGGQKQKSK